MKVMAPKNLTFYELCQELEKVEETDLMELLDINSKDLVEKFQDIIEDNFDRLLEEVDNLNEEYDIYDED